MFGEAPHLLGLVPAGRRAGSCSSSRMPLFQRRSEQSEGSRGAVWVCSGVKRAAALPPGP